MLSTAGLALFAVYVALVEANSCSITPIYVDYHNRNVDGGYSIQYGLFIGVGTPSQNQSLWPSLSHNETVLADVHFCQYSTAPGCSNQTHGFFVPGISQTFQDVPNYNSLDTNDATGSEVIETGTDRLNIFTHYFDPSPPNVTHVNDFPVNIMSNYTSDRSPWFGPAGLLGLGPSSTVLQHLYDLGAISSRSFGLYMGTGYNRAQGAVNGSLTLGGYDSGRFSPQPYRYPISASSSDATGFMVGVQEVTFISADGTSTVLNNSTFDAYITTSQYDLSFPEDVTEQFAQLTEAIQGSNDDNSFELPDGFQGSLTITLDSGLTVNYNSGDLANASNISPISADPFSRSDEPGPVLFGTSFLSSLYLIVNYDSQPPEFFLAPALPDAPYIQTQPLCPNQVPGAAEPVMITHYDKSGIIGAILGGVIGGIGFLFLVWWLLRRCVRKRSAAKTHGSPQIIDKERNPITAYYAETKSDRASYIAAKGVQTHVRGKESWGSDETINMSYFHTQSQKQPEADTIASTQLPVQQNQQQHQQQDKLTPGVINEASPSSTLVSYSTPELLNLPTSALFRYATPPPHYTPSQDPSGRVQQAYMQQLIAIRQIQQGMHNPNQSIPQQQTQYGNLDTNPIRDRSPLHVTQSQASIQPQSQPQSQPQTQKPLPTALSRDEHEHQLFSTQPLSPLTPPPAIYKTHRRNSSFEERRRQLGLTVKTEFDPPPVKPTSIIPEPSDSNNNYAGAEAGVEDERSAKEKKSKKKTKPISTDEGDDGKGKLGFGLLPGRTAAEVKRGNDTVVNDGEVHEVGNVNRGGNGGKRLRRIFPSPFASS